MAKQDTLGRKVMEWMLILISVGIACLFFMVGGYRIVTLQLFFLPVVLSGFFMGRYHAGTLAALCVILASVVTALDLKHFAPLTEPLVIGLGVALWAATLGLTAILVGTLSDERAAKMAELHEAYVGVVEVLSSYLQGGNPRLKARSVRVAEMSQAVAAQMKLPPQQIDDIRVAALLHDLGNVEITSRVISRAVDTLEAEPNGAAPHTFRGTDLVQSLGSVLSSALPLLLDQDATGQAYASAEHGELPIDVPLGARIIKAVRSFDQLTSGSIGQRPLDSQQALDELRREMRAAGDAELIAALATTIASPLPVAQVSPVPRPA